MSLYDYRQSRELEAEGRPFYCLIMAAMRRADSNNAAILREAFPEVWEEVRERYNASGGLIGEEMKA